MLKLSIEYVVAIAGTTHQAKLPVEPDKDRVQGCPQIVIFEVSGFYKLDAIPFPDTESKQPPANEHVTEGEAAAM